PAKTGASAMFPPAASSSNKMFPSGGEKDYESVKEPTVMKQAAELLEEALREAGGSIDEIGQNPLFAGASKRDAPITASAAVEDKSKSSPVAGSTPPGPDPHEQTQQSGDTLMMQSPVSVATSGQPSPLGDIVAPTPSVTPAPNTSFSPSQPISTLGGAPVV